MKYITEELKKEFKKLKDQEINFLYHYSNEGTNYYEEITGSFIALEQNSPVSLVIKGKTRIVIINGKTVGEKTKIFPHLYKFNLRNITINTTNNDDLSHQLHQLKNQLA